MNFKKLLTICLAALVLAISAGCDNTETSEKTSAQKAPALNKQTQTTETLDQTPNVEDLTETLDQTPTQPEEKPQSSVSSNKDVATNKDNVVNSADKNTSGNKNENNGSDTNTITTPNGSIQTNPDGSINIVPNPAPTPDRSEYPEWNNQYDLYNVKYENVVDPNDDVKNGYIKTTVYIVSYRDDEWGSGRSDKISKLYDRFKEDIGWETSYSFTAEEVGTYWFEGEKLPRTVEKLTIKDRTYPLFIETLNSTYEIWCEDRYIGGYIVEFDWNGPDFGEDYRLRDKVETRIKELYGVKASKIAVYMIGSGTFRTADFKLISVAYHHWTVYYLPPSKS